MEQIEFPNDFIEFLRLLNDNEVEYLLVGGFAVALHGYPRATADMDVWVARTLANAERIATALRDGPRPWCHRSPEPSRSPGPSGARFGPMTSQEPKLHHHVEGEGTPVVFTHGFLNNGDVWAKAVAALDGSVRSLYWDLRGHAQSEPAPPGQYGRSYALADLGRMLDVVGRPAVLVGHSLGGYLSLAYAIGHPGEVAGLVMVAGGPGFRNPDSLAQWNKGIDAMAATRPELPTGMEEISKHVDSMVMDRLGEITVPVAVVVGEKDRQFVASADVFDKYLKVCQRVVVADMGHMVHAKRPDVVADAVRAVIAAASS
jgi:pimeloyl-ACP methyl ester carboxylesterase